ncbi:hypothetical protein [Jiangella asiatica]|uniref:Uncharacterized protein n=1 Tax=Jiangella asiatica TaxID=2530372 RepID=A0A4R5CTH4_9ACTN|nr:hypothetical protein [Jiangella asiatica]TDE02221.1 hypothetical protein E1269_22125 [Jiangella asiatica]
MKQLNRREILKLTGAAGAAGLVANSPFGGLVAGAQPATSAVATKSSPLGVGSRGYYLTFGRIPTVTLETWRSIMDSFAEDGVDHVVLYLGGAFRSRKYPITWQYNKEHENVRHNFVGPLIDYAHRRNIKILLGFTPYTYDGTNQYAFQRPDLKGIQANGNLARLQGIHSWGYNLNPTKTDTKRFMLDYVREMYFEFYPNADGLLIESADIDICLGGDCGGPTRYYEIEYEFVQQISEEVWAHNQGAQILVYPHYFTGAPNGADMPYDPRWGLFFTPWTVNLELAKRASYAYYFDLDVLDKSPRYVQASVKYARDNGFAGYLPSHEFFTYVPEHAEIGDTSVIGRQLHPFGIEVIGLDENPYTDPLVAVNRTAYREYSRNPDLSDDAFRVLLGQAVFGDSATDQDIDDLLSMHDAYYFGKSLFSPAAQADPLILRHNLERGIMSSDDLRRVHDGLEALPAVTHRLRTSPNPAVRHLSRHAELITKNWRPADRELLASHLGT